jgi:DNA-binding transcriptional MerR regulator
MASQSAAGDVIRADRAAERFGVHPRTLRRWADARLISRSRVGRMVFYSLSEIEELIDRHTTPRTVVPIGSVAADSTQPGIEDWRDDELWRPAFAGKEKAASDCT